MIEVGIISYSVIGAFLLGCFATALLWLASHRIRSKTGKNNKSISSKSDILGVWKFEKYDYVDVIEITSVLEGLVQGSRVYKCAKYTNGKKISYDITGYYDGHILALSSMGKDIKQGRVLGIFLTKIGRNSFEGVRTVYYEKGIHALDPLVWKREPE